VEYTQGFVLKMIVLLSLLPAFGAWGRWKWDGFFTVLIVSPLFATWAIRFLVVGTDRRVLEMRANWTPVPREQEQPKEPVLIHAPSGFVNREKDLTELVRLAKVLKAAGYRIRARDLGADYADIRNRFSSLDGVTVESNGVVDLTDYGERLVDDLAALSPAQAENPPLFVLRRVKR